MVATVVAAGSEVDAVEYDVDIVEAFGLVERVDERDALALCSSLACNIDGEVDDTVDERGIGDDADRSGIDDDVVVLLSQLFEHLVQSCRHEQFVRVRRNGTAREDIEAVGDGSLANEAIERNGVVGEVGRDTLLGRQSEYVAEFGVADIESDDDDAFGHECESESEVGRDERLSFVGHGGSDGDHFLVASFGDEGEGIAERPELLDLAGGVVLGNEEGAGHVLDERNFADDVRYSPSFEFLLALDCTLEIVAQVDDDNRYEYSGDEGDEGVDQLVRRDELSGGARLYDELSFRRGSGESEGCLLAFLKQEEVELFLDLLLAFDFQEVSFDGRDALESAGLDIILSREIVASDGQGLADAGDAVADGIVHRVGLCGGLSESGVVSRGGILESFLLEEVSVVAVDEGRETRVGDAEVRDELVIILRVIDKVLDKANDAELVLDVFEFLVVLAVLGEVELCFGGDVGDVVGRLEPFDVALDLGEFTAEVFDALIDECGSIACYLKLIVVGLRIIVIEQFGEEVDAALRAVGNGGDIDDV